MELSQHDERPNFVVILADDMGFSDLGYFGGGPQTATLDDLAANGLVYTQFYNTPRCWPSRASLMTGLYPHQAHGAMTWGPTAPPAYQGVSKAVSAMIPEVLKSQGYATYHVGKWHIDRLPGNKPLNRGFERSYWTPTYDSYFNPVYIMDDAKKVDRPGSNGNFYLTDNLGERAAALLGEHLAKDDRPFFLYLSFTAPHFPLQAPKETIDKYVHIVRDGWDESRNRRFNNLKGKGIVSCKQLSTRDEVAPGWGSLSDAAKEDQITRMATHLAMIEHMDRAIGRVLETLRAKKVLDNTVVFFMSDNGASAERIVRGAGHDPNAVVGSATTYRTLQVGWSNASNTPFRGHKIYTYEGGISTPLIVYWPTGIAHMRGKITKQVGHIIDIVPTILEIANISQAKLRAAGTKSPLPGISLLDNIRDGKIRERTLFWEHVGNKALRRGDWKIVADFKEPFELYDLSFDRCEMYDLANEKPELLNELKRQWQIEADAQGVVAYEQFPLVQYAPSDAYRQK